MPLHITLISRSSPLYTAWRNSISKHLQAPSLPSDKISLTTLQSNLEDTMGNLQSDCLVSPANSFGIMDGGYDQILSTLLSPSNPKALTTHIQTHLLASWNGYIPPNCCSIVPLSSSLSNNKWNAGYIAVLPTMPAPRKIDWNKDLVYNATWSLLVSLERWNRNEENTIETVLLPGLGTGTGGISVERCAEQMILALKHFFLQTDTYPGWDEAEKRVKQVEETFEL